MRKEIEELTLTVWKEKENGIDNVTFLCGGSSILIGDDCLQVSI